MMQPTQFTSWLELQKQANSIRFLSVPELQKLNQAEKIPYKKKVDCITLDFSRQRINDAILDLLVELANECKLEEKIHSLMQGGKVNISENKAALHTSLRDLDNKPVLVDGLNIMTEVTDTREKIKLISESVRTKKWLGYTGKPITDIVNIGIGGSDLGPRLCINALVPYSSSEFKYHFISDADSESFNNVLKYIDPQTTLFIISSKSFTTKETLLNAYKAFELYSSAPSWEQHFIAVTAHPGRARQMGIKTILPIWEWVGGRYSLCSSINLITAIAIGYEQFLQLMAGAHMIDKHTLETPFKNNISVLLALLGIWNNNFLNIHNLLILTYSKHLEYFVPYAQQLDMESNGKSTDLNGKAVNYATGPIVWGGLGNQAQHSYLQLLCQGTHHCAADFITLQTNNNQIINTMCDYKIKVLSDGVESNDNPYGYIPGKMPLNHISLSDGSPFSLGALIALYEHKVFIQSVIWNINPFDQPGVESAKYSSEVFTVPS